MSAISSIEWTDASWNWIRGCTKISPGCKHCYAETFAERWRGVPGHPYEQGFDLRLAPERLADPLRWRASRRIFVNSMSDAFHERLPDACHAATFEVMRLASWHVFQMLTKRADTMRAWCSQYIARPLPNVWLGVSVENRKHGIPRIAQLRETPAAVRFLSLEPLLEHLGPLDFGGIHWVIVGGESGPGARAMPIDWVRYIRDQCKAQGVAFFFKQWGGVRKKIAGRELDGCIHNNRPHFTWGPRPTERGRLQLVERVDLLADDLRARPLIA